MIRSRLPKSAALLGSACLLLALAALLDGVPSIMSDSVRAEELPANPDGSVVSLTFDDGLDNTYDQAAPILARHGLAGTVYVTTDFVGEPGRMTWEELRDLQDRFAWEIGSHSITHPALETLSDEAIEREVAESKRRLEAHGLRVDTFASPFGSYNHQALAEIARNYSGHRAFRERFSFNRWPYDPLRLRVQSVETSTPVEAVIEWIDAAVEQGEWLVLVFHELVAKPDSGYDYSTTYADFEQIVDHLAERRVRVATVHDVILDGEVEWLLNETFVDELSTRGWSADTNVQRHDGGRGAHPDAQWSVELNPSPQRPARLVGPPVAVKPGANYRIDAFVDRQSLVDGDISVHVEELGATGSALGTQVVGWVGAPVVLCRWAYSPVSPEVAAIRINVVARGSEGQNVYVDNLRVVEVDEPLGFAETR